MRNPVLIHLGGARRRTQGGGPGPRQEIILPDYYASAGVIPLEGAWRRFADCDRRTK